MTKFNVGDMVRYLGGDWDFGNDLTIGNVYAIVDVVGEDAIIEDDVCDDWVISKEEKNVDKFELVTEPTEGTSVEASPSVIELLSNLALRLTKVEDVIKPTVVNETPTQAESVDNVNSPQHYRHGRFETIELIEDITKKYDDGFVAYCVGNAVKYIDRAPFKHGSPSEDLRKAAWYLTRAAEHTDGKEAV